MTADVPLYDFEHGLREIARARRRRDELTHHTTGIADQLALHVTRHFGPEALETAGLSMVLAAASLGVIAARDGGQVAQATVNILAFAGQRLVLDARSADGVGSRGNNPQEQPIEPVNAAPAPPPVDRELAEAERWVRTKAPDLMPGSSCRGALAAVLAEYDRRTAWMKSAASTMVELATQNGQLRTENEGLRKLRYATAARRWAAKYRDALINLAQPCCQYHSRVCEPPSELCCGRCSEAGHPAHDDGSTCCAPDLSGWPDLSLVAEGEKTDG